MFDNALAATDLHVDIGLVDLPKARFAEEIRKAAALGRNVEPVDSVPTDFDFAGFALTSGVYLDVASVRFGSDLYRVDMTGEIRPESASPNSATAKLALVVEGFDEVIRSLRSPRNLGGEFSFEAMFSLEFADRLAEMQALGAETVGEDGRKLWRYDLLATPDGAITLNGKDAKPLLGIP